MRKLRIAIVGTAGVLLSAAMSPAQASKKAPTVAEAKAFVDAAEAKLLALAVDASRNSWIQNTYITHDSEVLAAQANERLIAAGVDYAKKATRFDKLRLPEETARKLRLLKLGLTLAAPSDPKESEEVTRLGVEMESEYGKGKYCPPGKDCLDIQAIEKVLAESRDASQLLDVWRGWHAISVPMRPKYQRFVELANKGARELGFTDSGAMWRSKYDMAPDAFAKEVERLWEQLKPFYVSLHAYVRWKLREKYGDAVPANGPIPAHLLGNIWAQDWSNVYDLVAPKDADPGFDLTKILKAKNPDAKEMVRYGERFFTSLGFAPLPDTFWERSLFTKPRDREVVCHASAWDVDNVNDLRIKMCITPNAEDFSTIHHELGHNFYQRAYNTKPGLFRDSANDGFHEAVGDTIALSITPEYLVKIGLLDKAPDPSKDIGLLLSRALEKIAFLPFGLLIDQWRWKVFSGEITPANYNAGWWDLRTRYQGIAPAVERTEKDFDPGAKYHIPANVPYTRYFLAAILQFQFHRALAQAAGCTGPLHRCSIYGNKEAGRKLDTMLQMGLSRPWQDALEAIAGSRQMDATAIRDYFAPLQKWLDEQNRGKPVGW
ncbi:MAG TPA: M2 family metallopeptidase [Thermoanaerobaculia bacterium]|nr:M2 family metallopeptidase [Thermoanaerobaculia bacterium]